MTAYALEINDAGLVLARGTGEAAGIVDEQPGIALLEGGTVLTGHAALAKSRIRPLGVQNDFWRQLAAEPLPRVPVTPSPSAADLAFTQLGHLLEPVRAAATGLLLAVPAGYSREQLGLLLGVAAETGVPLLGLADSALLATARTSVPRRVLHLDLQLHQAVLSVLEVDAGGYRRSRFELLPRHGWLALQQAWLGHVAGEFVRRTRFDPLHEAASEQTLVDLLPAWLERFTQEPAIDAAIGFRDTQHAIELQHSDLVAAAQPVYAGLLRLVQAARPAGERVALRLSHRFGLLPGLLDRFAELRDCDVTVLARGAAALGALHHADAIRRPADALSLVYRLPGVVGEATTQSGDPAAVTTPKHLQPTHLLHQGRAWSLRDAPLELGWSVPGGRRLLLPQSVPGLSRQHCTVRRKDGAVVVEDHSTYGSFVNDERVKGEAPLVVGDRLRLGTPGVTLELIQLVNDDGTPQD